MRFYLTGGQAHDLGCADYLLLDMEADTLLADKAYDADQRTLARLAEADKTAVLSYKFYREVAKDTSGTFTERTT